MEEDITVRFADEQDAEALLAIYAPYVRDTAVSFEYEVPSAEEFSRRIGTTLGRYPFLVAERGGEPLGYAYAGPFKDRPAYDWAVETSVYVRQDLRRRGVGRTLYDSLERLLDAQGILNMEACIACPNGPDARLSADSIAYHEHMGFRLVGRFSQCGHKFGRWYDMAWMEKVIGEHVADQPAVHPIGEFRNLA